MRNLLIGILLITSSASFASEIVNQVNLRSEVLKDQKDVTCGSLRSVHVSKWHGMDDVATSITYGIVKQTKGKKVMVGTPYERFSIKFNPRSKITYISSSQNTNTDEYGIDKNFGDLAQKAKFVEDTSLSGDYTMYFAINSKDHGVANPDLVSICVKNN